ncbi:hypothetical protein GGI35DRAFT_473292 [Trichoderma velutinum]
MKKEQTEVTETMPRTRVPGQRAYAPKITNAATQVEEITPVAQPTKCRPISLQDAPGNVLWNDNDLNGNVAGIASIAYAAVVMLEAVVNDKASEADREEAKKMLEYIGGSEKLTEFRNKVQQRVAMIITIANEYLYPRPRKLDLDNITISRTYDSYQIAVHVVDFYHQQAVTMTRKFGYTLSRTNRRTPSNNKLWKHLKEGNLYCRAHFITLAATYGIDSLTGLQYLVERAGDTSANNAYATLGGDISLVDETPAEPVQPTIGLRATTPISIPSTTTELEPRSPTYSPQLDPTSSVNEGQYSPAIEIAALRDRIRVLEDEKAILLQLVHDQAVALSERQQ